VSLPFLYCKSSIKAPNDLFFSSTFVGRLKREGGLFNLAKCISGRKVSLGWTCGYWALYCFFCIVMAGTNKHAHGFMGVISWKAWVLVWQWQRQHSATQRIWFYFQLKYIFSWPSTTTSFASHSLFTLNVITIHFNSTLCRVYIWAFTLVKIY